MPNERSEIVTWRAQIPGGWLVSVWGLRSRPDATGPQLPDGSNWGGGLTFVPDPAHAWSAAEESEASPS